MSGLFSNPKNTRTTIAPELVRGVPHWRVRFFDVEAQRVRRRFFASVAEAEKFAGKLAKQNRDADGAWALLADAERALLMAVWRQAQLRGVDLMAAVVGAKVEANAPAGTALGAVIDELIVAKRNGGRARGYVNELENFYRRFSAGREGRAFASVDLAMVEGFLNGYQLASRSTVRARLATLFNFGVRRGYRPDNPCARLESVTVAAKVPRVFSASELATAMAWMRAECPRLLPWFALSTFCGLRPEEAAQTAAADVNFKEGWVKVEAQTTKVRMRRVVYPRREAMRFLAAAVKMFPVISLSLKSRQRGIRRLRAALGWARWPQDVTRHTAASLWLAVEPDVAKVAAMLGNSPGVLLKHYKAVMTKAEANKMWKLINHG
jgi:integrase